MREKPRETRHERGVRGCSAGIERCSRSRCSSEKRSVAKRGRWSDGGAMRRAAIVQFFVETTVYRVVEKHRVVKKTKKRIFLEEDAFDERRPASGDWRDYHRSAFVLDRREFGSHGQARRSSRGCWYHCTYYADPEIYYAERRLTNPPDHFKALDLPADASTAEIKTAFRR